MKPRVGLFVTCLVDLLRPSVGMAAVKLIEAAGCTVEVPEGQTCCGQPAFNSGDRSTARDIALQTIRAFSSCDYIVVPSGSCAAMLKMQYPRLLDGGQAAEASTFAARVHELSSFLINVRGLDTVPGRFEGTVSYHDACSGLRDLGIAREPRALLGMVGGLELREMGDNETCCGFGGLFSIKYPDISNAIVERKQAAIEASKAELVVGGDLGCLIHIAGKLRRAQSAVHCRHVAEVLSGELDEPPIAMPGSGR